MKSELWKEKYTKLLSLHTGIGKEQRQFIVDVINYLKPELFEVGSEYRNQFAVSMEREIRNKAIQLFGFEKARLLLTDPSVTTMDDTLPEPDPGDGYVLKCQCSTSSSYCGSNYDCLTANCEKSEGCGTFWTYTCNGRCVI